jgi:pyruvate,water dikinase
MGIWKSVGDGEWVGSDPHPVLDVYTRGNAGEVYPEVFTPLSFSVASEMGEQAMRNAILGTGLIRPSELDAPLSTAMATGVFGGYAYLNLSTQRLLSARVPGGRPTDADRAYFGVGNDLPPYTPTGRERSIRAGLAGLRYTWRVVRARSMPVLADDLALVEAYEAGLSDPADATDDELGEAATDELMEQFSLLFQHHLEVSAAASTCVTLLGQLCERQLGGEGLAVQLLTGLGDVDSAAPAMALWDLGRFVADDPDLSDLFDRTPIDELWERLRAEPAAGDFVDELAEFLRRFGSRGPNEWDTAFDTWETRPALPLALIDRMRLADADHDPHVRQRRLAQDAADAEQRVRAQLSRPLRRIFDRVLAAARMWSRGRERSKTTVVRMIHSSRLRTRELDRRLVARSGGAAGDLWFVVADEVEDYLADPGAFAEVIAERRRMKAELAQRVPPFAFAGTIPPLDSWELRGGTIDQVAVGDSLSGLPGCPGVARGRARVILDPADPRGLEPGDVLVAPLTDPSWTPLFVPAEAVVVDVGAVMSHAVIVSRELGIPCAVSVVDATRRIPDGALVEVDGGAGTVTVLAMPEASPEDMAS